MFELYYNQRIKTYPNGMQVVTTFNKPVFNPLHNEKLQPLDRAEPDSLPFGPDLPVRLQHLRRAKQMIFDIAFMNVFDYFVTLTFNDDIIDGKDDTAIHKCLTNWFGNMVKRKNCMYLAVPEYHKSGRIHFHLLMSGDLNLVDSGTVLIPQRDEPVKLSTARYLCPDSALWRTVYNLKDWKNGFSTVIEFKKCEDCADGTAAIAKYLTKYITKDLTKVLKHYYYAGGNLVREVPTEYRNVDFDFSEGVSYDVADTELQVKYLTLKAGDTV